MFTVEARKAGKEWVHVGTYTTADHAAHVKKATHRGNWESRMYSVGKPDVIPLPVNPDKHTLYDTFGVTIFWFIPSGEVYVTKSGEKREKMMRLSQHKLHVKCRKTGLTWVYTGSVRNGQWTYSDSRGIEKTNRQTTNRLTYKGLCDELERFMGDASLIGLTGIITNEMPKSEYEAAFNKAGN